MLIVEFLSKSTNNYDKGEKFDFYRSTPEFQEYILIEQSRYSLAQYTKTSENQWLFTESHGENNILKIRDCRSRNSFQRNLSISRFFRK